LNHGKEIYPSADLFKSADELSIAMQSMEMEGAPVLVGDDQQ
jgi:hypothetical protein